MVLSSVERGVAVALSVGGEGEASHVVDWLEQAEVEQGTSAAATTSSGEKIIGYVSNGGWNSRSSGESAMWRLS